jgi:hypothetical protein
LTVAFTAPSQYAAADVVFGQKRDLSGKTLRARVRLVSGPAAGVWVGLYACDSLVPLGGSVCAWGAMAIDAAELAGGARAPLALDLDAPVPPIVLFQFSPAGVDELGIEVYSAAEADAGTADGGTFASTGDLVFEIDTVTE